MDKKAIIFDFDGTIADSMPVIMEVIGEMAGKNGLPVFSAEQIKKSKNFSVRQIIDQLKISKIRLLFSLRKGRKLFNKKISQVLPIPGIILALEVLKQRGYRLGILSSNSQASIKEFVQRNGINLFDFISTEKAFFGKGRILKKLVRKYGFEKSLVFYIGDETRDIEAAREAGIKIVAVSWGFNSQKLLAENHPDYLIQQPKELLDIFQ
jgi:phosphoglycolate phosphatase